MHHVHDVFISADAVKGWDLVRRNRVGRGLQSPARVGEPDDPSLSCPTSKMGRKIGPSSTSRLLRGARIVVFLEAQQAEMPRV